jgi:NAD(P)-dependent dehydrogenase (short-subunit alcohol dehydrogenase family)
MISLVTGAAGNLGMEHAVALQGLGLHVILTDLSLPALERRVDEFGQLDRELLSMLALDVTDEANIEEVSRATQKEFGAPEVLVNNAQGSAPKEFARLEEFPLASWRQIMDVNLGGTFLCCKHFGAAMAANRRGSIINMSSVYGLVAPDFSIYRSVGFTSPAVYTASKAGIIGLSKYLATYWAWANLRVNCISLGGIKISQPQSFVDAYSARVPLGRMGGPADIRGIVSWLASDASSYVTGQNLFVDGGLSAW